MPQWLTNGLAVQARVVWALMLREIHTINGKSQLGYLWVLIQSAFGIGVFWAVREFVGAHAPHGMPVPIFLVSGFAVWGVFSGIINKSMSAVSANRALLTFPQVTELDVLLARLLVITATELVTAVLLIGAAVVLGFDFRPVSAGLVLFVIFCVPFLGLGIGMICSALSVFVPALEKIVPMVLRILFFVSGVFFAVSVFRHDIAQILLWNPVMQAIEILRTGLHASYVVDGVSPLYLIIVTVSTLTIGGFLERYVRRRRID